MAGATGVRHPLHPNVGSSETRVPVLGTPCAWPSGTGTLVSGNVYSTSDSQGSANGSAEMGTWDTGLLDTPTPAATPLFIPSTTLGRERGRATQWHNQAGFAGLLDDCVLSVTDPAVGPWSD